MEDAEIIRHKDKLDIFKQLQNDKMLIKMYVLGKQYERLTFVTGTHINTHNPYFIIDCPEDLMETITDVDSCRMLFEFVGNDNLFYNFKTTGKEITRGEIFIRLPEVVYRMQRRKNFRMTPPLGTKICINNNFGRLEMNVLNISRGGVLVLPVNLDQEYPDVSELKVGSKLSNIELTFPFEEKIVKMYVEEALVLRRSKHPVTKQDNFGLQFTDMEKSQEKILMEFIFSFQRNTLRKRL